MNNFKSKVLMTLISGVLLSGSTYAKDQKTLSQKKSSITQVRNATLVINYAGKKILVDPMLAKKGTYPGFPGSANSHLRNPLVELPIEVNKIIDVDAVLITHLHLDHWDDEAQRILPKDKKIFVQNTEDEKILKDQGFKNVISLTNKIQWEGISITRTDGVHGTEEALKKIPLLGTVSGFVFSHPDEKSIYLAGDTVWNKDVKNALDAFKPDVIILNSGAATMNGLPPIIMDENDVLSVIRYAPKAKIIATHMEAVNHCVLTRQKLTEVLKAAKLNSHVEIPKDGETIIL